ncbi:MAG: peptidoglycan editing factor PgeF [Balneolaceae bacterium]
MIDYQKTALFEDVAGLDGWFTRRSPGFNREGTVPGLNCGLGATAPAEEVSRNRQTLFDRVKIDPESVASAGQVHGDHVEFVESGGFFPETDALVTTSRGVTLTIQVADCAAILLTDPEAEVIGAVHAGWRGSVNKIVTASVNMLYRHGAKPERVLAAVCPCIGPARFEVGEEVARLFDEQYVDRQPGRKPHVNLRAAIREELEENGIPSGQIEVDTGCTFTRRDLYYSWRRDREKAGRMLAMIRME